MKYQVTHHSVMGGRSSNQDRVAVTERDGAVLMVLADGLGGHAGGELAAQTAVQVATRAFQAIKQRTVQKPSAFLALTMMQAHAAMHTVGAAQRPPVKPRTTCVLCLVQNGYAYWAHVGDSRLYHFRDGKLLTRTFDDTSIEQFQRQGVLTEEEMQHHPGKSSLLRCLGSSSKPSITLGEETLLYRNDVLLLCTDGLWEAFAPPEISSYLTQSALDEALEQLVYDAEEKMGARADNTSAVCLRWEDGVTSSLPLQGKRVAQTDAQQMLAHAAKQRAREKMQQTLPGKKSVAGDPLDGSLEELEDLLKRFGPRT